MTVFRVYDAILQSGETEAEAIEYARGFVWCECEATEQSIGYHRYIDAVDGVEVWYDYGADYYFFCPVDNYDNAVTQ